jgi:hypothetical protein
VYWPATGTRDVDGLAGGAGKGLSSLLVVSHLRPKKRDATHVSLSNVSAGERALTFLLQVCAFNAGVEVDVGAVGDGGLLVWSRAISEEARGCVPVSIMSVDEGAQGERTVQKVTGR